MNIEKLNCEPGNKSVTVTLTYDEVRDIANGLYLLTSDQPVLECNKEKYKEIHAKAKFLFDMIKHGNIQENTVKYLYECNNTSNDMKGEKKENE